jgi:hypothetical protein
MAQMHRNVSSLGVSAVEKLNESGAVSWLFLTFPRLRSLSLCSMMTGPASGRQIVPPSVKRVLAPTGRITLKGETHAFPY